ncbi:hypothetical protein FW778_19980 [Ginsengibacter hankyongi]|uniref:Uncharacterized protein n=1 Tax=Ginsengibacter hankyongi TaxID=2607284 RepID=A0A5J5ICR2_9BACT|nr:hypothetical protein [Ginsengibacter hankyongi]KAA9035836.1 hypothetical protein FW778_19980 [Ginsengibacter hankyongi]
MLPPLWRGFYSKKQDGGGGANTLWNTFNTLYEKLTTTNSLMHLLFSTFEHFRRIVCFAPFTKVSVNESFSLAKLLV